VAQLRSGSVVAYCDGSAGILWEFALMTVTTTRSHFEVWTRRNGQLGAMGQPAETLREGEEIAEKIAETHGLPVVRLTPAESAQEQTIDAIYIVERRTVSR
jgi:hypothetical protein